jgi:hypothetical protein
MEGWGQKEERNDISHFVCLQKNHPQLSNRSLTHTLNIFAPKFSSHLYLSQYGYVWCVKSGKNSNFSAYFSCHSERTLFEMPSRNFRISALAKKCNGKALLPLSLPLASFDVAIETSFSCQFAWLSHIWRKGDIYFLLHLSVIFLKHFSLYIWLTFDTWTCEWLWT